MQVGVTIIVTLEVVVLVSMVWLIIDTLHIFVTVVVSVAGIGMTQCRVVVVTTNSVVCVAF